MVVMNWKYNMQKYFGIKYLGVPHSPSRLHVIDWEPLKEKMGETRNLERWDYVHSWEGNYD
jgi:hypothetical protein